MMEWYLYKHITDPTWIRECQQVYTLDFVFTNNELMIENVQLEPPLGISDDKNVNEQWYTFIHKIQLFTDQLIPRHKVHSNPNSQLKKLCMNTNALKMGKKNISCGIGQFGSVTAIVLFTNVARYGAVWRCHCYCVLYQCGQVLGCLAVSLFVCSLPMGLFGGVTAMVLFTKEAWYGAVWRCHCYCVLYQWLRFFLQPSA